jgi:16S rRNA processing protein RimM
MALLEIGRIVCSHGLAGRMKVRSFLESNEALRGLPEVFVGRRGQEAAAFGLDAVQGGEKFFILKLRGIEDRDGASMLVGSSLWIPSERLGKLPEDEYYWKDIIGLRVVAEDGEELGRVESVFPTGGNDVFVCRGRGEEVLLPAIGEVVRKIDLPGGVMTVRLLKGLGKS